MHRSNPPFTTPHTPPPTSSTVPVIRRPSIQILPLGPYL